MSSYTLYERGGVWQARVTSFSDLRDAANYVLSHPDTDWGLFDEEEEKWVKKIELILAAHGLKPEDVIKKRNWRQEGF